MVVFTILQDGSHLISNVNGDLIETQAQQQIRLVSYVYSVGYFCPH